MKLKALLPALVAISGLHAASPQSLPATSLSLDAKTVAAKKSVRDDYKTDYGSYDKSFSRARDIEITLRNLGRTPFDVVITTHFIGKFTASNERLILSSRDEPVKIQPNTTQKVTASSGAIEGKDLKLSLAGVRDASGARIEGWIVLVRETATKKLLCCKGSDSHLDALARTPGELEKLQVNKPE